MAERRVAPGARRGRPENTVIADVMRRRARSIAAGCAASTVHQACEALVPLAIGLAVQRAVAGSRPSGILIAVAGVLGLFLVLATGGAGAYWILTRAAQREAHDLRVRAMGRILADPQVGRERTAGELMSIVTSDTTATAQVTRFVAQLVSGVGGLAVTVAVLVRIDLWIGLCVVLVVPPLILGIDAVSPRLEGKLRHRQQAGGLTAALAAEIVHALRPLRGFGGVTEASRRYRTLSRTSLRTEREAASASAVVAGAGLVATALVTAGIAAAAGPMAFSGRIDVGEFVTVVAMASFVADPVSRVASAVQQLATSRAGAARVAPLLAAPEPAAHAVPAGQAGPLGPLRLRSVSAGPVRGLDLDLGPGEMLGVVTSDPAAAAAIAAVIGGDRRPDAGRAYAGDRPLDTLPRHDLRHHILVAPHAVHLLGRTLESALNTGRSDPHLPKSARCADAAGPGLDAAGVGGPTFTRGAGLGDAGRAPGVEGAGLDAAAGGVVVTGRGAGAAGVGFDAGGGGGPAFTRGAGLGDAGRAPGAGGAGLDAAGGGGPAFTRGAGRVLAAVGLGEAARELADGGSNLSGGQRQRLALARAVAADPPVLVLQDPLTAVDAVTEAAVAGRVAALRQESGRATVVITNSPALLACCDRVVFLDGSGTPATGTHAQLLDLPDYARTVLR